MGNFLQFGTFIYFVTIGFEAYLAVKLWKTQYIAFIVYTCFVVGRSLLMFTLLSQGNGGRYVEILALIHALDVPLIAWIVGEQLGWPKVFSALGIFGGILTFLVGLNQWTMFALLVVAMLAMLKESANSYILSGFVIAIAFPAVLQNFSELPKYLMYVPTFSFAVAQGIWWKGLRDG